MLNIEQLVELDEQLKAELEERQTEILTRLNRNNKLDELFNLLGLESLLSQQPIYRFEPMKEGKIVVLGESRIPETVLLGIAKDLGFDNKRFEFCLNYEDVKTYNTRKLQYNETYCLIMFGPVPHSGVGKGDDSSIISAIKRSEGYPPVIRLGTGELKITKSNFRTELLNAIRHGIISLN